MAGERVQQPDLTPKELEKILNSLRGTKKVSVNTLANWEKALKRGGVDRYTLLINTETGEVGFGDPNQNE